MKKNTFYIKGQSLVEILIAIGISVTVIGGAISLYVISLRSNVNTRLSAVGSQLAQEMYGNVQALAEADWHAVYSVNKETSYHLTLVGGAFFVNLGTEEREIEGTTYTRSFIVENVQREASGAIVSSGGIDDPSTQRVTVTVSWPVFGGTNETKTSGNITRSRNVSLSSTNWVDGPGNEGIFLGQTSGFSSSSNIDHATLPGTIRILNF